MPAIILGLESSCDDSAVALVTGDRRVIAQAVVGQNSAHQPFGGVVPEIAARAHVEILPALIEQVLADANIMMNDVDAVAATAGPGLIGGVMVALLAGKGLALSAGKPFLAVNHLEGHALSPRLVDPNLDFPYLLLLVSGGHCQILEVRGVGNYRRLATTIDDAAGEAFDKVARLLGLGFPGGPYVDRAARDGDPAAIDFPRGLTGPKDLADHRYDFSFSGLKTAVARWVEQRRRDGVDVPVADVAAAFQEAVVDVLVRKAVSACTEQGVDSLLIGGGVAANSRLRAVAEERCAAHGLRLRVPRPGLCTDNGAMVAALGAEMVRRGRTPSPLDHPTDSALPVTDLLLH
jgi:N6-L-threonylcarbamoyladenine synthase